MRCLVHGGAGAVPGEPTERLEVVERAARAGADAGTPVATDTTLGLDPRFDAGIGSAVQSDGRVRTDAGPTTSDRPAGER